MYLILCHPHTALPLMVVSASIPLALPARHNLFAHLNPYPAFIPLLSFSIIGFSGVCSSCSQTGTLTHTLTHSASHNTCTHIYNAINKNDCVACSKFSHTQVSVSEGEKVVELLSNHVSRLCYSGHSGRHVPGSIVDI